MKPNVVRTIMTEKWAVWNIEYHYAIKEINFEVYYLEFYVNDTLYSDTSFQSKALASYYAYGIVKGLEIMCNQIENFIW